jgi:hypothetical protein
MKLSEQLKNFGLNPIDWKWSLTKKRKLVLVHRNDAEFRLLAQVKLESQKLILQEIYLLSV